MKFLALPLVLSCLVSCSDEASSQQSNIGPERSTFVVTASLPLHPDLSRRLSLVMNPADLILYKVEGTSVIDMHALAIAGKTILTNGYSHIERSDFLALRFVATDSPQAFDVYDYEANSKVGRAIYYNSLTGFVLSELCTGSAEKLCTFSYDKETDQFDINLLPQAIPEVL